MGSGWRGIAPEKLIKGERIKNRLLPGHYRRAAAVLNDHWPAMRDFGYVSNRLFDVLAVGGVPVSDAMPGIGRLFGTAVEQIEDRSQLREAVARAKRVPAKKRRTAAKAVAAKHSFDQRAVTIARDLASLANDREPEERPGLRPAIRVHVVAGWEGDHPSFTAYRRLIAPLNSGGYSPNPTLDRPSRR